MTTLFDNPATLRNLSMDELMHYAGTINHPVIERMVELYFNGTEGHRAQVADLEDELRDLQASYDDIAYEHDELEGAVERLSAKMDETRRKLEDLITWDHPDEIQEELKQFLERLD